MENLIYFAKTDGVCLEHLQRTGKYDMKDKHFHNEYEIFFILEGKRHFFLDNRAYFVEKGSLILVDENKIHMTKSLESDLNGHERIILYISRDKMKELDSTFPRLNLVHFFKINYGIFPLNEAQQQQFLRMYQILRDELSARSQSYKAMVEMEIIKYFITFMRENHSDILKPPYIDDSPKYRTIYDAADYVSRHFTEKISLEDLAARYYLSKYYFCRTFKEITGYGITEYINIHRIQRAKRLLEETQMSISEIAHSLGYESITHFEKVFKTYIGVPPLRYRKTLNNITYKHS